MRHLRAIHFLSTSRANDKIIFALVSLITVALLVDTSVIKIYYLSFNQLPIVWRNILFFIICSIYLVGVYIVYDFARQKIKDLRSFKGMRMNILSKIVVISQYLLAAIMLAVIVEIIASSHYNVVLLTAATWISYTTAVIIMLILAYSFFAWFNSNRDPVCILYGLSSAMLAINVVFTTTVVSLQLANLPSYVLPHIAAGLSFFFLGILYRLD